MSLIDPPFKKDIPADFKEPSPACLATLPAASDVSDLGDFSEGVEETGAELVDLDSEADFFAASASFLTEFSTVLDRVF